MSPNPAEFLDHLKREGYHPRSDKHSNSLAELIVADLIKHCPKMRDRASRHELVFDLNFTLHAGTSDWNVDLVLGQPQLASASEPLPNIVRESPSTVEIAIELKAVMTEHRKAVKNRKRDLEAHHEHVHVYNERAVAAGVLLINASPTFRSPLRTSTTTHRNPTALVEHCIAQFRGVAHRSGDQGAGLDAKCAIVVDFDNVERDGACFITRPPAPSVGDPLHYDTFIRTVCDVYSRRF